MDRKHLVGMLLVGAAASVCAGTDDSITYEEVALGASMDEYAAKLPDHQCQPAESVCRFVLGQCRRINLEADLHADLAQVPANRDGGMPAQWWRRAERIRGGRV